MKLTSRNVRQDGFCMACECVFKATQKFYVVQHISSIKYQSNMKLKNKHKASQIQLEKCLARGEKKKSKSEVVSHKLCKAFVAASVPFYKLSPEEDTGGELRDKAAR